MAKKITKTTKRTILPPQPNPKKRPQFPTTKRTSSSKKY